VDSLRANRCLADLYRNLVAAEVLEADVALSGAFLDRRRVGVVMALDRLVEPGQVGVLDQLAVEGDLEAVSLERDDEVVPEDKKRGRSTASSPARS